MNVSYSCMQLMSKIYKRHNNKVTTILCNRLTLCNCQVNGECPMDSKCQTMDAVYDCHVTSPKPQKIYFGLTERKCIITPNLKWSVIRCATSYPNISKRFLLCLYEKVVIITYPRQHKLLNKRSELFCKCCHESKTLEKL